MIDTDLTRMFGLRHPLVLAPTGGVSGGRPAAAVSDSGGLGLGLVGGGYGDAACLRTEPDLVAENTGAPSGVGLLIWSANVEVVRLALGYRPHAFMLSFGDPARYVLRGRAARRLRHRDGLGRRSGGPDRPRGRCGGAGRMDRAGRRVAAARGPAIRSPSLVRYRAGPAPETGASFSSSARSTPTGRSSRSRHAATATRPAEGPCSRLRP